MRILTAWVETDGGYEIVAAANDDDYSYCYFEEKLEREEINYDQEPRVLRLDIDDSRIADLFTDRRAGYRAPMANWPVG